jgi:hypothetical protein
MCKQKIIAWITRLVLYLHHTKIIHFDVVDWIKPITFKKHSFQLFGATEGVLNDFFKYAIVASS